MAEQTDWHQLFALMMNELLLGSGVEVEREVDLAVKEARLDVIIRLQGATPDRVQPDGLHGHLLEHNLISFKSHHDTSDGWALNELIAYYVGYRKARPLRGGAMIPEDRLRLFFVSGSHPDRLFRRFPFAEVSAGVYEHRWGSEVIRLIAASRLPLEPQNAPIHLFSAVPEVLEYARSVMRIETEGMSSLLALLFDGYQVEGLKVAITREDFIRQTRQRYIALATPEERVAGLAPEERVAGLAPEERVAGLAPEERVAGLAPEELIEALRRTGLRLTPEQLAALAQIGPQASAPPPT